MTAVELHIQIAAIEQDIRQAVLSFPAIAKKHGVPGYFVTDVWNFMCECDLDD